MFKKKQVVLDDQNITTLISDGCTVDGNLKAPAFARVDGHINGDVAIDEGLILGEKGTVKGDITTKDMVVYGTINGNIDTHSLEIKTTGKIFGEIKTQVLKVDAGAVYTGSISMTTVAK